MKHWVWYLVGLLILAAICGIPFQPADVAKLQPVQVIQVSVENAQIVIRTDTGDAGSGSTLDAAFSDLKRTTPGYVFLETAQYLLVTPPATVLLKELGTYLRPGCSVYMLYGAADLSEAAPYLAAHTSDVTLRSCIAEDCKLPLLLAEEGKIALAG